VHRATAEAAAVPAPLDGYEESSCDEDSGSDSTSMRGSVGGQRTQRHGSQSDAEAPGGNAKPAGSMAASAPHGTGGRRTQRDGSAGELAALALSRSARRLGADVGVERLLAEDGLGGAGASAGAAHAATVPHAAHKGVLARTFTQQLETQLLDADSTASRPGAAAAASSQPLAGAMPGTAGASAQPPAGTSSSPVGGDGSEPSSQPSSVGRIGGLRTRSGGGLLPGSIGHHASAANAKLLAVLRNMPLGPLGGGVDPSLPRWKVVVLTLLGLLGDDVVADATGATARRYRDRSVLSLAYEKWRPAVFDWAPDYNYKKHLSRDVVAGLTIGIVLIPQGLAYATLAGLPPVYGIYTGLPGICYALFGTSRQAAIGPMSIPALLIAAGINAMDPPPATEVEYIATVMSITALCGALLLVMGWLNLGFIVRFISRPVLSGFTSAASVLTMVSVAKDLLGVSMPRSQVLQDYVVAIARALPATHGPTVAVSLVALLLLHVLGTWRVTKRVPAPLSVVLIMLLGFALAMTASKDDGVALAPGAYATRTGIALVGDIPSAFPTWSLPSLRWSQLPQMLSTAVSVTFVGFIESIAVAKMYSVKYGYEISPSSELKALGITNLFASVTQSFPVMGAFGRSAVNDATGAKSQLSGVVGTFAVILLLLVVMPALYYLPKAVLAAIIVMAVKGLLDVAGARALWRVDKRDFLTMLAAFLATLFLGVLQGVVSAMVFSLVIFIAFTTQPKVEELGRVTGTVIYRHVGMVGVTKIHDVRIIRFLAPLFFANCTVLKDRLLLELTRRKQLPPRLQWRALVLCFSSVSNIDSTSIQVLEEVVAECHGQRVPLLVASANAYVEAFLYKAGLVARLGGPQFMFRRVHEAVRAVLLREITHASLPAPPPRPGTAAAAGADGLRRRHGGSALARLAGVHVVACGHELSLAGCAAGLRACGDAACGVCGFGPGARRRQALQLEDEPRVLAGEAEPTAAAAAGGGTGLLPAPSAMLPLHVSPPAAGAALVQPSTMLATVRHSSDALGSLGLATIDELEAAEGADGVAGSAKQPVSAAGSEQGWEASGRGAVLKPGAAQAAGGAVATPVFGSNGAVARSTQRTGGSGWPHFHGGKHAAATRLDDSEPWSWWVGPSESSRNVFV
jgi:SulP family sulfate permease